MFEAKTDTIPVASETDIVIVRQTVRRWASEAKLNVVEQTKLITAASELARNTLIYGRGGSATIALLEDDSKKGIRVVFEDSGPGIADLDLALQDGYTTGGGLGLGLSGSKRLVSEFEIFSEVGKGTKVTVTQWKNN